MKYGFPSGCAGCQPKNRGEIRVNHNEECRRRIEKEMRKEEPDRYKKTLGRLAERVVKEGDGRLEDSK